MGKILNAEEGTHIVKNYSFKSLQMDDEVEDIQDFVSVSNNNNTTINTDNNIQPETPPKINDTQIDLIEQLLKKSDVFASSISSLEAKLQQQADFYEQKLAEIRDTSYKSGYNEGYNKAKEELENKIKEQLSRLIESVHKIEEVYKEYQSKAENIEKELVGVAVDIAEEVISKELAKSSKEVALSLTKELINDIKEATKIEIKVNPLDYEYVKDNIHLDKIKIIPDNAISPGGVVILSDAGNIEAEIHERFKNIKNHILKG